MDGLGLKGVKGSSVQLGQGVERHHTQNLLASESRTPRMLAARMHVCCSGHQSSWGVAVTHTKRTSSFHPDGT